MKKGLILGRFQPLHMGHLSIFETVIDYDEELVICVGSSNRKSCLLYTSPSPRDRTRSRMPSSA